VLEELGPAMHPIPNSFPQEHENKEVNYTFFSTQIHPEPPPRARWTDGPSIDGKGTFIHRPAQPMGGRPELAPADKEVHAQMEQMTQTDFIDKVKDFVKG
jgi:Mn-containing catalase